MTTAPVFPSGWTISEVAIIDSTNAEALRQAAGGASGPHWITAREQTAGRGRSGRVWQSAGSSLAATLLFSPTCRLDQLAGLALVAGVATHGAIEALLPLDVRPLVRLKWPNDVLIDRIKASGILIESTVIGGAPRVAIGIGINIAAPPEVADRGVAALVDYGVPPPPFEAVSRQLAHSLAEALTWWANGFGFDRIRDTWLDRSLPLGEPIRINAGEGPVAGSFAGLAPDGSLVLRLEGGGSRLFSFGDVALGPRRV